MPDSIGLLATPLHSLLRFLTAHRVPHVVIGGVAVSQLGYPRATADIDVLALVDDDRRMADLLADSENFGFRVRIPDAEEFARKNRVLLLEHADTGVGVDISLGMLPFEREVVERSSSIRIESLDIPLPAVEDLIIMKGVARRPHDLQDIKVLIENNPALDTERIKRVLSEFAEALEMPEVLDSVLKLL